MAVIAGRTVAPRSPSGPNQQNINTGATGSFLARRRETARNVARFADLNAADAAAFTSRGINLVDQFPSDSKTVADPTRSFAPVVDDPASLVDTSAGHAPVVDDPVSRVDSPAAVAVEGVDPTSTLRELSEQELALLLDGIAARFGMNREQLLAQENQLGIAARGIIQQASRAQEAALETSSRTFQERGILRSGLRAKDVGRIGQATAGALGAAEEQRLAVQNQNDAQRAGIEGQLLAEQAATRQAVESGLLQFEEGQTVADLLATLPSVPGVSPAPISPATPIVDQPVLEAPPTFAQLLAGITAPAGSGVATSPAPVGAIAQPGGTALTPAPAQGATGGLTSLTQAQLAAVLGGLITGL